MRASLALICALLMVAACGGGGGSGNGAGSATDPGDAPFGLDSRPVVSGLNIPTDALGGGGSLSVDNPFPRVRHNGTTTVTHANDGSNRIFITQKGGVIHVFNGADPDPQSSVVLDLSGPVDDSTGESGLLGLAFDPQFSTNRYFYVNYVTILSGNRRVVRVSQFRMSVANTSVAEPASERVVLEFDHPRGSHFGGWLGFGPSDGMLYISSGDGDDDPNEAQNTRSFFGKVLRVRVDAPAATYSVPADNPVLNGTRNEVWAYGFRNPWRCSFDRANGNLWCGDVGQSSLEEVNLVKKGANYGWPYFEGDRPFSNPGSLPYASFEPPVHAYSHSEGIAVVGGFVYRGNLLGSSWRGKYFFTDWQTRNLWALTLDSNNREVSREAVVSNLVGTFNYTIGEDEAGELYVLSDQGVFSRVVPGSGGPAPADTMPPTLSATGLFADIAALTPAPGLIDFAPNAPFWSGAGKRRWVVVPNNQRITFSSAGNWDFPAGSITVKHFDLPLANGSAKRLETRVMVNRSGNGWTGYSYRWRDDNSDADLVPNGASASFDARDPASGGAMRVNWTFPSQAQCLNCHTAATGRVLGLNTRQLNSNHAYAASGITDNQLRTLNHIGLFAQDIGSASSHGTMPNPTDSSASLESRAKAYLDTNCSVCHRPQGGTPVNMDLRYGTALSQMNIVGVASSGGGTRVVAGNHGASDLWLRASSTGANRMPPLGVSATDTQGINLLRDWINSIQ